MSYLNFKKYKKIKIQPKQVANAFHIYARLFYYIKDYWFILLLAAVGSMMYSGIGAWFIYFLKPLLNDGLYARDREFLRVAPFLVMGVIMLRGCAVFISNYFIAKASRSVIMKLRQDLFAHLQRLPAKFYDHSTKGQLLSIILYGVDQVANASADVITTMIQSVFLIIGLLIVMFSISWKLSLLYFAIFPIVTVIIRMASVRVRRLSLSIQDSIGQISHAAEENVEAYKVVRAFQGEAYETEKFNKLTRVNRTREMKVVTTRSLSGSVIQLTMAFALALTLYIASMDIASSFLSAGGFVSMIAAMLALLNPMKELSNVQNKLYRGLAGAQNVFELMDEKVEVDAGTVSIQRVQGKIEFKQVSFAYDAERPILKNISLIVNPGEVVALVGKSGSGKSTLVSLLPRFYHDYTGVITLDDVPLDQYALLDLRRQFALVSQNITLFHDTIFNNIAYGSTNADAVTEEDVLQAAEAAYVMDFVKDLPDGFNSLVGENGILLSGGQRQRIAIARAILKNAPILILDEATSSLDTESERYIQKALEKLMQKCTTLVIAHRLSTVEHADKIVVFDDGRVVETGTHRELLEVQGYYAKLYQMREVRVVN